MSLEIVITILCLGFLFLCAAVEAAITQSSSLALRMMAENPEAPASDLLNLVLEDKMQVLIPLNLGNQLSIIIIVVLMTHVMLRSGPEHGRRPEACALGSDSAAPISVFRLELRNLITER